ncbi:HET-domain-containing protein, partial [Cryphonectria parasitica EP155]
HMLCSLSGPRYLPSRLVEVQPQDSGLHLKLVRGENLNPDAKYTALSYCWGNDSEVLLAKALKTENLESYETEIPWETLPQTLQDAAVTTHRLGMHFVWVDSLCIIQDDDNDKVKEIAQMAQVYSHATLTIMVNRAARASDGFLHQRSPPLGTSNLLFRSPDGTEGWVSLYFKHEFWHEEKSKLDKRGWAMQEHLLSRRTLEIGTYMTEWSCRTERGLPSHSDGWSNDRLTRGFGSPFQNARRRWSADDVLDTWEMVVKAYCDRSLSLPTDKILAISGIAERFASSTPGIGRYAAGLWEEGLPTSLMWQTWDPSPSRPTEYQGPSWSWTAIRSRI